MGNYVFCNASVDKRMMIMQVTEADEMAIIMTREATYDNDSDCNH